MLRSAKRVPVRDNSRNIAVHMTEEQLGRFWEAFATDYTGQKDHADFDRLAGKFACLDIVTRAFIVPTSTAQKVFFWFQVRKLVKEYF